VIFASKWENVHQNSELFEGLISFVNRFEISATKSKAAGQDLNPFEVCAMKPALSVTDISKVVFPLKLQAQFWMESRHATNGSKQTCPVKLLSLVII